MFPCGGFPKSEELLTMCQLLQYTFWVSFTTNRSQLSMFLIKRFKNKLQQESSYNQISTYTSVKTMDLNHSPF